MVYSPDSPRSGQYLKYTQALFPRLTQRQHSVRVLWQEGMCIINRELIGARFEMFFSCETLRILTLSSPFVASWAGWSYFSGDGVRKKEDTQPFVLLIQKVNLAQLSSAGGGGTPWAALLQLCQAAEREFPVLKCPSFHRKWQKFLQELRNWTHLSMLVLFLRALRRCEHCAAQACAFQRNPRIMMENCSFAPKNPTHLVAVIFLC